MSKKSNSISKKQLKILAKQVKHLIGKNPKKCHLTTEDIKYLFGTDEVGATLILKAFDTDQNGTVEWRELVTGMSLLTADSLEEKANYLFKLWDADSNGMLDRDEIFAMVRTSLFCVATLETIKDAGSLLKLGKGNEGTLKYREKINKVLEEGFSEDEINRLTDRFMLSVDTDKDGLISQDEFVRFITLTNSQDNPLTNSLTNLIEGERQNCSIF
ncbi:calcium binding protein [Anaeramoeba flamelloides]|uniref:Calcium binding protein n=1 Tax=Anaeramoeba flamelloides TaxID=1746091 RepID=A0AAV7YG92_9EUKA|nr:calcium binding protein [Anaeramoeba flamelloides]